MKVSFTDILIKADKVVDNIPIINTLSNTINLIIKALVLSPMSNNTIGQNRYLSHLNNKEFSRTALLSLPVLGQIIVALKDKITGANNQKFIFKKMKTKAYTTMMKTVSGALRDNKEFMMKALNAGDGRQEYHATTATLMNASLALKNNKEFMLQAAQKNAAAVCKYASSSLLSDSSFTNAIQVLEAKQSFNGIIAPVILESPVAIPSAKPVQELTEQELEAKQKQQEETRKSSDAILTTLLDLNKSVLFDRV